MIDEDPAAPPRPSGHQIDVGEFLGDVAELIAYIQAGSAIASIWRGPERDPDEQLSRFRSIFEGHQKNRIPRLLISVAATLRSKVDDGSWRLNDEVVGWITYDQKLDPERGETIGIREACNKIIHAKQVIPEYSESEEGARFIGAMIGILGDRAGKPWSAEINLQQFCIAIANCDFYPHGSGSCRH